MISSFTDLPMFGLTDFGDDLGDFAGGYYSTSEDYGNKSGEILNMVLNGKKQTKFLFS